MLYSKVHSEVLASRNFNDSPSRIFYDKQRFACFWHKFYSQHDKFFLVGGLVLIISLSGTMCTRIVHVLQLNFTHRCLVYTIDSLQEGWTGVHKAEFTVGLVNLTWNHLWSLGPSWTVNYRRQCPAVRSPFDHTCHDRRRWFERDSMRFDGSASWGTLQRAEV